MGRCRTDVQTVLKDGLMRVAGRFEMHHMVGIFNRWRVMVTRQVGNVEKHGKKGISSRASVQAPKL